MNKQYIMIIEFKQKKLQISPLQTINQSTISISDDEINWIHKFEHNHHQ